MTAKEHLQMQIDIVMGFRAVPSVASAVSATA